MSMPPQDSGVHLGWDPGVGILKSFQEIQMLLKTHG